MTLRVIFMGTPDFAVPTLRTLHGAGHDIVACYTQPPRPAGRRGLELKPSPVQSTAETLGIGVRSPTSLKDAEEQSAFRALNADVAVVVAYGLILPRAVLDAPRFGCLNGHASLLPRWRGAAPIQRAIMAGDARTGTMVMRMEEGLDTGRVAARIEVPIMPTTTSGDLHDDLADKTALLMRDALDRLKDGDLDFVPQDDEGVVYARKIEKAETRIDWSRDAERVARHINGLSPFPGAWCEIEGTRLKVLRAEAVAGNGAAGEVLDDRPAVACGTGAVRLLELQRAGSKAQPAVEFQRGNALAPGARLA